MELVAAAVAILLVMVVILFVVIITATKSERRSQERIRAALEALHAEFDREDTERFDSILGYSSGAVDGVEFGYFFAYGDKNTPRSFKVTVACPSPVTLHITRETSLERFFKAAGITAEPVTGDGRFDHEYFISCDGPGFARDFLADPDKREAVRGIFRLGFTKVSLDEDRLTAISAGDLETMTAEVVRRIVPQLAGISKDAPSTTPMTARLAAEAKSARVVTFGLAAFVLACGVALLIAGVVKYQPLDSWEMFFFSVRYSAAAFGVFMAFAIFMLKGRARAHVDLLIALAITIPGFTLGGHGVALVANGYLDNSEPAVHTVLAIDRKIRTSKNNRNYYVSVRSWRAGKWEEELKTSRGLYERVEPGKSLVAVISKSGRLGFEWVVDFHIAPPDNALR